MASTASFSGRNSRTLVVEDSVGAVLGGNICGTERQTVSRHLCADRTTVDTPPTTLGPVCDSISIENSVASLIPSEHLCGKVACGAGKTLVEP